MGKLGILEIVIILGIIVVKFAVIIGSVLYAKRKSEKKRKQFLEQEAARRVVKVDAETNR